jgi:hypothetical protein
VKIQDKDQVQEVGSCEELSIDVAAAQFSNYGVHVKIHFDPTCSAIGSILHSRTLEPLACKPKILTCEKAATEAMKREKQAATFIVAIVMLLWA